MNIQHVSMLDMYHKSELRESVNSRVKILNDSEIIKLCHTDLMPAINFIKEIKYARTASKHKFGPKIYSYGFKEKIGYIHMERLNKSLYQVLTEDTLTKTNVESLKKIIKKMWKKGNFVHMDLHSENIWFTKSGHARLIDFGITADKYVLSKCSKVNPFVLNKGLDDPIIIDKQSAIQNSAFEIMDLIETCQQKSKNKELLLKLKYIFNDTINGGVLDMYV